MSLSSLLSLLAMALGAVFVAYVPARRPRERSSWAMAAAAAGLLIYYLTQFLLYGPGLSLQAAFFLQKLAVIGTGTARIGAVALALSLRETPVPRWERVLASVLVVAAVFDMAFVATMVPRPQPGCILPAGVPMLHCGVTNDLGSGLAMLTTALTFWLFYRTFRLASATRRRVLMRYLLPATLLICLAMAINLVWSMLPTEPSIPTVVLILPAAALLAAGLLRLEEVDRGLHLSAAVQLLIAWVLLLIASVVLDGWWLRGQFPIVSLLTLVTGLAAGLAYLARRVAVLERQGKQGEAVERSNVGNTTYAEAKGVPLPPRLDIHLLGPFRVEREGAALPSDSNFWRSDKTKSLLAYLIIARDSGVTRTQIVDALWPIGDDGDGEAERLSINAVRSYLSTLRKVLEPERPRGNDGLVPLKGGRYYFRGADDVRVDVWEFERQAGQAEQLTKAGRGKEAAEAWELATALHGELGLLPDENYLPASIVEPARERLRQRSLMGLRWLAQYYSQHGPLERAVVAWEMIWHEAPLDSAAYQWLAAHYAASGQTEQLRVLESWRQRIDEEAWEG